MGSRGKPIENDHEVVTVGSDEGCAAVHLFRTSGGEGFPKNGGVQACVYFDENSLNYVPARELEGVYSCLDFFHTVDDPFSKELLAAYAKKFPNTKFQFTAGSAATAATDASGAPGNNASSASATPRILSAASAR
jgi:hypothetical protein